MDEIGGIGLNHGGERQRAADTEISEPGEIKKEEELLEIRLFKNK